MNDQNIVLSADTPFGIAAGDTIRRLQAQMMKNLPGTKSGDDIEALHDMRVATRRLRSALRIFGDCFPKRLLKTAATDVGRVTRALGAVRDQDVFIDFLQAYADGNGVNLSLVLDCESEIRDKHRMQMLESLDAIEADDLPNVLLSLVNSVGRITERNSEVYYSPFASQAGKNVSPRLMDLVSLSPALDDPSKIKELHEMRIAAKRLRYTMEAFIPCFGEPLVKQIDEVKALQEQLGDIHDCDIWMYKIRTYEEGLDVASEERKILETVRGERRDHRDTRYAEAFAHWENLVTADFPGEVMHIVSEYRALLSRKEGANMADEIVADEAAVVADSVPAPEPESVKAEPVKKETAKKETVKKKVKKAEAAKALPQHPRIVEIKDLLKSTAISVSDEDKLIPKIIRQFEKLEVVLEELPSHLRSVGVKDAAKAEKLFGELVEVLQAVPKNGDMTAKQGKKLAENIEAIRKKLSERAKK